MAYGDCDSEVRRPASPKARCAEHPDQRAFGLAAWNRRNSGLKKIKAQGQNIF
jgi:hypothetical protein